MLVCGHLWISFKNNLIHPVTNRLLLLLIYAKNGCLEQYLADFSAAVKKAQSTPFLRGEGALGWRASFDWFVANQSNVYAVREGKYDGPATGPDHREGASDGNAHAHIDGGGSRSPGVGGRTSRGDPIYIPRQ